MNNQSPKNGLRFASKSLPHAHCLCVLRAAISIGLSTLGSLLIGAVLILGYWFWYMNMSIGSAISGWSEGQVVRVDVDCRLLRCGVCIVVSSSVLFVFSILWKLQRPLVDDLSVHRRINSWRINDLGREAHVLISEGDVSAVQVCCRACICTRPSSQCGLGSDFTSLSRVCFQVDAANG